MGIEVASSIFNISTKIEVSVQPHASASVLPKEITSVSHGIVAFLGLIIGLNALKKRKNFLSLPGIEPPFIEPVA
jgi:hypothetical protein